MLSNYLFVAAFVAIQSFFCALAWALADDPQDPGDSEQDPELFNIYHP
jgi:hypothetical protein